MIERAKRLSRRNFLIAVSAGGAATAAAMVAKNSTPGSNTKDHGKRATRGYQSSEHVGNYYRTTKV